MKKIFVVTLVLLMSLNLVSCSKNKDAKGTTKELFEAIKDGDQKVLDKIYLGEEGEQSIINDLLEIVEDTETLGDIGEVFSKSFLDFKYSIEDIEEDGDTALAKVKITSENWPVVLSNASILISAKAISMTLDGKSEKQMQKAFKKIFNEQREETDDVDYYLDIKLIKDDGVWKVDLSNETSALLEAISGGLS
jgi:hypothetical protein